MQPVPDSNHEEWDLLYSAHIPVPRISELTGARAGTIHRYLEGRRIADPSLITKRAAAPKGPSKAWRNRLESLRGFIAKYGRFPAIHGEEIGERQLYGWLAAQRHSFVTQQLGFLKMQEMTVLGDWITSDQERSWNRQWHERLAAVVEFVAEHGRLPRHSAPKEEPEHRLAIWIATQHQAVLHRYIPAERLAKLNSELPGWRKGEK